MSSELGIIKIHRQICNDCGTDVTNSRVSDCSRCGSIVSSNTIFICATCGKQCNRLTEKNLLNFRKSYCCNCYSKIESNIKKCGECKMNDDIEVIVARRSNIGQ